MEIITEVPMFNQITENIFIGSWQDAMNPHRQAELKKHGITAVLNVALDLMNTQTEMHKEFTMVHVPLTDGHANSVPMCYLAVLALETLLDEGRKVLVHCHVGKSRSVSVVATHLVRDEAFSTLNEAETFIQTRRPIAEMHPGLKVLFQRVLMVWGKQ